MVNAETLTDVQKKIFEAIPTGDIGDLKTLLAQLQGTTDFVDENGMTPLQHACYKGNTELVQTLLDQGADVNSSKHGANYTALHFAALSGNAEICLRLLQVGANPSAQNSVNRTPAQMAAFVGNHAVVACINNYIPKSEIEYFTKIRGQQTEPILPVILLDSIHKFIIQSNVHPVRIALNIQKFGTLSEHLKIVKKVLELLTEREVQKRNEINEIMAFKYHYLGYIVGEIIKCREYFQSRKESQDGTVTATDASKSDFVELFAKRVLKENKLGQLEYIESTVRECVREFPFRESTVFKQVLVQLTSKDALPALDVIRGSINGQRGFVDDITYCSTCGEEKPDKKCSKCKQVQYCDRECQRLHWFAHKKVCARPLSTRNTSGESKPEIDSAEISEQLQNLITR
ncbi:ankyrin repeat and MYND domain-containing protein 2 [Contarinia nasturtii]|uniref:ankyrin repeat and MYND domain-containing protein 2 n=1 Tax=Contarinia nasturtii TaxID=265458 RepID=UPI0012D3D99A|nr:ankyrin repeat and MYND domain-containing protein 2 [Contarinia nasturtii]